VATDGAHDTPTVRPPRPLAPACYKPGVSDRAPGEGYAVGGDRRPVVGDRPSARLAVLSDVHGNPFALEAVLADVEAAGGVDGYLVLGDLAAAGHDPVGALERLTGLPNVGFARGNTDRYVTTGDRPPPRAEDVRARPELLGAFAELHGSFAWTQGVLSATGWLGWLADLPLEQRLTLPDGTRLLGVHAAPGEDDGPGVPPHLSDDALSALVRDAGADLVCVGHTHWPVDRRVPGADGAVRVVNLGSVSNPLWPDLRASYVLLEADGSGYRLTHRRVAYDQAAVVEALRPLRHPGAAFILSHFLGQRRPPWDRA
jgi:predicted phosphodiesterase